MSVKSKKIDTKDRMAEALLQKLRTGTALNKLRIRDITDLCGVDRQTFYYYFKNIEQLAEYAYKKETERFFDEKNVEDIYQLSWKDRIKGSLKMLEQDEGFRKSIVPALGESNIQAALFDMVSKEINLNFVPRLAAVGLEEDETSDYARFMTYLLVSVLVGWLKEDVNRDVDSILDTIEEMLHDYLTGVQVRLGQIKICD